MPERIRIAHLITSLDIGGTELVLYRLTQRLDPTTFEHVVGVLKPMGTVGDMLRTTSIPTTAFDIISPATAPAAVWRVASWLRAVDPDIVQTWLYHADFVGLLASRLARRRRLLWNVRAGADDQIYRRSTRAMRWLCARLSHLPAGVVVNSEAGLAFHRRLGYAPKGWTLIPNGIDTELFKPDPVARTEERHCLGLGEQTPVIGMIARLDPTKGHDTFVNAAALLSAQHPEVAYLLVGPGVDASARALVATIAEKGLTSRVHLLGSRRDVPRLIAACDITASCSVSEGSPNVVLESLACGVPCVVSDAGDSHRLVGTAGTVVRAGDAAATAAAWRRWLRLPSEERIRLGLSGREAVTCQFGLSTAVSAYETLYRAVMAGQNPRSGESPA